MKYIIVILLTFNSMCGICQLQMKVKHLYVKNVIQEPGVKNWDFYEHGPEFKFIFQIKNQSDTTFSFPISEDPHQWVHSGEFWYDFNYRGKQYAKFSGIMFEIFSGVVGKDTLDVLPSSISILPHQSIEVWTYPQFLTSIPNLSANDDYTRILLEILPTLKV